MIQKFISLIRNILSNRIGWILAVLGLCSFLILKSEEGFHKPLVAECVLDLENPSTVAEINKAAPLYIGLIRMAHFPSLVVGYFVTKFVGRFFSNLCEPVNKIEMIVLHLSFVVQWLLVGYGFERLFWKRQNPELS